MVAGCELVSFSSLLDGGYSSPDDHEKPAVPSYYYDYV